MNELDEVWTKMINQAIADARETGRQDVAEYLSLKATNDFLRATSVKWLFDSMLEIAARHNRNHFAVEIENENPHNFAFNKANMVGSRLSLRQGVRCLSLEAGWTRTPTDGFMRGGALAAARITHFGIAKANEEIVLLKEDNFPQWFSIDKAERKSVFDSNNLQKHFQIFIS
jgi:hypothetical protein